MEEKTLQEIENKLGYRFENRSLLKKTFTHSSAANERLLSNERLEFLGDSVLNLVTCQMLFNRFPTYLEGDLTKMKSMLVSRRSCARVARQLGIHEYLLVGKGMVSNRALAGSIAAGLLEAVIAAIYLDGGYQAARDFIQRSFKDLIEKADAEHAHGNFKSVLQQYAQQNLETTPIYNLLDEKGPDHDKCFETQVMIEDRTFPSAWGNNKKDSEQKAAYNALQELGLLEGQLAERED